MGTARIYSKRAQVRPSQGLYWSLRQDVDLRKTNYGSKDAPEQNQYPLVLLEDGVQQVLELVGRHLLHLLRVGPLDVRGFSDEAPSEHVHLCRLRQVFDDCRLHFSFQRMALLPPKHDPRNRHHRGAQGLMQHARVLLVEGLRELGPQHGLRSKVDDDFVKVKEVVAKHRGVLNSHILLPLEEEPLRIEQVPPEQVDGLWVARLEAHEYRQPVCDSAEEESCERQKDGATNGAQVLEGYQLYAAAEEAQSRAAMLDEAELLLPQRQEEVVQELLVLHEHGHDHAVVIYADRLVAEDLREPLPSLRARLLDLIHSSHDELLAHRGRHPVVHGGEVLRKHGGQRRRDDAHEMRSQLRSQQLGVNAAQPLVRAQEVRPGTCVGCLGHLLRLSWHDTLPAQAYPGVPPLPDAEELQRPEHHLDRQPDVEPGEQQRDDGDARQQGGPTPLLPAADWQRRVVEGADPGCSHQRGNKHRAEDARPSAYLG
mmetsp:Transcript_32315/g.85312  ORF Transcript_32315/g.85312 Transcript_32315/m.85312 type:complete len:483 (-) Transcript_32315:85-1533(-)